MLSARLLSFKKYILACFWVLILVPAFFTLNIYGLHLSFKLILLTLLSVTSLLYFSSPSKHYKYIGLVVIGLLVLHSIITISFFQPSHFLTYKLLATLPIFILICLSIASAVINAKEQEWELLFKLNFIFQIVIVLSVLGEYFFPELFLANENYRRIGQYSGIFSEPSNLAIAFVLTTTVSLFSKNKIFQFASTIFLMLCLYLSPCLTFIFLTLGLLVINLLKLLDLKKSLWLIFFLALIVCNYFDEYHLIRLKSIFLSFDFIQDNQSLNFSSMIYLQGWADVWNNNLKTYFLGVGFNRMGLFDRVDLLGLGFDQRNINVNKYSGGFIFAKFLNEFGIFAALIIVYWMWVMFKEVFKIINKQKEINLSIALLLISFFIFISRSPNYFHHLYILFPIGHYLMNRYNKDYLIKI